jgi:hypothetical protein
LGAIGEDFGIAPYNKITAFPAMGIMTMVQSAVPGSNFFRGKTVDFGVPWASLSVALNVTITALIAYRILRARSMIRRLQESNESLEVYVSVAAILIESALPFVFPPPIIIFANLNINIDSLCLELFSPSHTARIFPRRLVSYSPGHHSL